LAESRLKQRLFEATLAELGDEHDEKQLTMTQQLHELQLQNQEYLK
jgi:hypothetical protein